MSLIQSSPAWTRFTQGMGNGDMHTCKNSFLSKKKVSLPSIDTSAGPRDFSPIYFSKVIGVSVCGCVKLMWLQSPSFTLSWMVAFGGSRTGRKDSDRGQIGVSNSDWIEGCTMDPPAESE